MNIIEKLNKSLGKEIASYGSKVEKVETLSTGLVALDMAIGGGFPKGRISIIKGLESVAKTSLALHFIAECQKKGLKCAFIDAEYAFNSEHALSLNVDLDELIMIHPDSGEEAFEAVETLVRENMAKVIIVDSVSALVPRPEAEAEYGKAQMGGQARLISQGMRKIVSPLNKGDATLIFINQLRHNLMGGSWDPFIESGGIALKYYTSVALKLTKASGHKGPDGEIDGLDIRVKVTKNKIGTPFRECLIRYIFNEGWEDADTTFDLGVTAGIITREKNSYFFEGKQLANGRDKSAAVVESNPELQEKILFLISEQSNSKSS